MSDQLQNLDISHRLRELMLAKSINVSEIAVLAGVSKSAMEKYLAGPSSPRAIAIVNICNRLAVSCDWLLTGKENMDPQVEFAALTFSASNAITELLRDILADENLRSIFENLDPSERRLPRELNELVYAASKEIWSDFVRGRENTMVGETQQILPEANRKV